jgi:hypothetical protein
MKSGDPKTYSPPPPPLKILLTAEGVEEGYYSYSYININIQIHHPVFNIHLYT